jgi:glutamine amidotransferase-like uncharacterized protein
MRVLVYEDYVHNHAILHRRLGDYFGAGNVGACDADAILSGCLDDACALLVMPGGADLAYCEKLDGAGNAAIRAFVENGGAYLGICAGAYYACAAIEWAMGTAQEIAGPRELAFFPGMATGPAYELIEEGDIAKCWEGTARLDSGITVHYEAGPVFAETDDPAVAVLARYEDLPGRPPAIVSCAVGRGRAVLSSPHAENTGALLQARAYRHEARPRAVAQALLPFAAQHENLWTSLLAHAVTGG